MSMRRSIASPTSCLLHCTTSGSSRLRTCGLPHALPDRQVMVERQLRARGIDDERVLEAMRRVPRELFVPEEQRVHAYDDAALPIGYEQTISQPYMVALICSLLSLNGTEKVLDVGTGSGYQAAVLAELAGEVHTIERIPELAESARASLAAAGYVDRVHPPGGAGFGGPLPPPRRRRPAGPPRGRAVPRDRRRRRRARSPARALRAARAA